MKPVVHVNTHYTRSVNLERDADSIELIKAYIPTSRALRTFAKFSSTFNEKTMPRSWSLIGPYGSGKSSFSVFSSWCFRIVMLLAYFVNMLVWSSFLF